MGWQAIGNNLVSTFIRKIECGIRANQEGVSGGTKVSNRLACGRSSPGWVKNPRSLLIEDPGHLTFAAQVDAKNPLSHDEPRDRSGNHPGPKCLIAVGRAKTSSPVFSSSLQQPLQHRLLCMHAIA